MVLEGEEGVARFVESQRINLQSSVEGRTPSIAGMVTLNETCHRHGRGVLPQTLVAEETPRPAKWEGVCSGQLR